MTFNANKYKDDFLFLPLGGSSEIGMNLNMYHLDGKWLLIDFGAGFAEDYLPGVDMIVPDISFIYENQKDIIGLVITHAHEDHLGAMPYIWDDFDFPVYTTPFTAAFLRAKLADSRGRKQKVDIIEIENGGSVKVGPFDIELVQITHSVPEMNGVFLRTEHGNIFHSGDWKFDNNPFMGAASDKEKLKKFGDEGVLAIVSDSTNVFSKGRSGSEGDLHESLTELIAECEQMVVVTTFASNVARIMSITKAAERAGRKVVLAGRSLWRIVRAAKESGYLKDAHDFLETSEMGSHKRSELLIISTGCQGEALAATNKIATKTHRDVTMKAGDTIIFSSKVIPGNDKRIFRLFNMFVNMGVEVLTEKDHFVHVSGHPNIDEMEEMYNLVRPKFSIPVHGEQVHLHEHVRLAKTWGVEEGIQVENGTVVKLSSGKTEKLAQVKVNELAVDGFFLLAPDSKIMKMRRRIQKDGVIVVTLVMNKNGLATKPILSCPGSLDAVEDLDIISYMQEEVENNILESRNSAKKKVTEEKVKNLTRSAIRRVLKTEVGKNPPIEVNIRNV